MNREALLESRVKNQKANTVQIFSGSAKQNLADVEPKFLDLQVKNAQTGKLDAAEKMVVEMSNVNYKDSKLYHETWDEIGRLQYRVKNAAQAPSAAELAALVSQVFIDITRRAQEAGDLTDRIATEITNFAFAEDVNLREIYKYRGKFNIISGANDTVPLIEQYLGDVDTTPLSIAGIGWKDSLKNMLFNTLHSMQKVNEAVADAYTDSRNSLTIGQIVAATYVVGQIQDDVVNVNQTYEENMYDTIRLAIKKLRALLDPRTHRPIAIPSITLLCNSANTWDIERVLRGQLDIGGAAGTRGHNRQGLPIAEIIEYDRGITDGFGWGKDSLDFPGVTVGEAYIFVPREFFWILTKRPLTMETGRGSVLTLSTEERAWYACGGRWSEDFFGSSYPDTSLVAGYGAIVKITLPTEDENT